MFELVFTLIKEYLLLAGYVSGSAAFPEALSKEEEQRYVAMYAAGDKSAGDALIEHNLRLVAHIAKKYSDDNSADDIISVGTIGLIKGIRTYDASKNARLSPYIARCIENEIRMYLRAGKKFRHEISIDEVIGTDKEGNNMTFADILPAEGEDIADEIGSRAEAKRLAEAMKRVLTDDEYMIICSRYGLMGRKRRAQREIAAELGISRSYVSRIEKRCLKKLAAELYGIG